MHRIPMLPGVAALAEQGFVTGASKRNWAAYGHDVELAATVTPVQQDLLTDPQTAGGLLVSCTADAVDSVLRLFRESGFAEAALIGEMSAGPPKVHVS
jgi:selenide,water dikinase